jgi:predicted transposase/invertase (TIGR01784 family)
MPKRKAVHISTPLPQSCYAELTDDFVFKKAFASEEDKDLLIALLNVFLEPKLKYPVKDVHIENPYIKGETKSNRDAVLDIHCQDSKGNKFIVEMQVSEQKFFIKRALYYLCMAIANSGKKGKDWDFDFPRIYSLNFLNFDLAIWEKCDEIVQYLSLQNDNHPEISHDYINLVFVRLPKFKKTIEECKSLQDKLIFSLCHAHEFNSKPKQLREKLFDRLFEIAKISNFTNMEWSEYISRHKAKHDRYAEKKYAREKGMAEGLAKGRAEGLAKGISQGISKGVSQIAKSMLQANESVTKIMKYTKLSKKEILALK